MQANVGQTTNAEFALYRILRRLRLRFAAGAKPAPHLRCTADAVLREQGIVIFVDGCFWHGCPDHFRTPKSNRAWWREKIADNRLRDVKQSRILRAGGWSVVRIWEHELRTADDRAIVERLISKRVRSRSHRH